MAAAPMGVASAAGFPAGELWLGHGSASLPAGLAPGLGPVCFASGCVLTPPPVSQRLGAAKKAPRVLLG